MNQNQLYYQQQPSILQLTVNYEDYNQNNFEPYYNSYWYSRSDCSSSSIETTSPQSNRQLYYNHSYYGSYNQNNFSPESQPDDKKYSNILQPVYSNHEKTCSKPDKIENKFGM
jgi:hypothetical protein